MKLGRIKFGEIASAGAVQGSDGWWTRTGKFFEADRTFTDMNGLQFSVSSAKAAEVLPQFAGAAVNLAHEASVEPILDFLFEDRPQIEKLWLDGKDILAQYRVPDWFQQATKGKPVPFSSEWDVESCRPIGGAYVVKGAVKDAVMMAAFAQADFAKTNIARLHDSATDMGAECGGKTMFAEAAKFMTPEELKTIQKVHDATDGDGKHCDAYATRRTMYYSEDEKHGANRAGKDKPMNWFQKLVARFQKAGLSEEDAKKAATQTIAESDDPVVPLVSASFAESPLFIQMQATIQAQAAQMNDLSARFGQQEATAQFSQHQGELAELARQGRITAAQRAEWEKVAKQTPAAFAAALPVLKQSPVLAQFQDSKNLRRIDATEGGNPGDRLVAIAEEKVKAGGGRVKFGEALEAACRENPDLAQAHKMAAPSYSNQGGNS